MAFADGTAFAQANLSASDAFDYTSRFDHRLPPVKYYRVGASSNGDVNKDLHGTCRTAQLRGGRYGRHSITRQSQVLGTRFSYNWLLYSFSARRACRKPMLKSRRSKVNVNELVE